MKTTSIWIYGLEPTDLSDYEKERLADQVHDLLREDFGTHPDMVGVEGYMDYVSGTTIATLLIEEIPYWEGGVCRVTINDDIDIVVLGADDEILRVINPAAREYQKVDPVDAVLTIDLDKVAETVNIALRDAHKEL